MGLFQKLYRGTIGAERRQVQRRIVNFGQFGRSTDPGEDERRVRVRRAFDRANLRPVDPEDYGLPIAGSPFEKGRFTNRRT